MNSLPSERESFMGCSNCCTSANFSQISQTIGYPSGSLTARLGDIVPLADQLREYNQRQKDNARAQIAESARTAGADPVKGTIEQQLVDSTPIQATVDQLQHLADPMTSAMLAGAIIGTSVVGTVVGALVEAISIVFSGIEANKE